ncbi:MAG: HDIG domain-containing protein [Methanocalculus sp.]|uniref:HD domain-containing protein n=1 Tax=Methanocalculus sp. TaxID=2004547 RepID=UPI0027213E59|nr:HD domain-containing protein [Methanocalculus sp.]MDO9540390.1 HDIG domain-containing protein [Methanocalculus sp.]
MVPDDPLTLLNEYVRSETLIEHCVATGAIMRSIAPHLSGDPDLWEVIGILHDIDYEVVEGDMERHGVDGEQILLKMGVSIEIAEAVRKHNHHLFSGHTTPLDLTLQAADSISGLIIACALVKGGAIDEVTAKTVKKKMKDKGFAAGCDRERIRAIEPLMNLDTFITAAISGVSSVWRRPADD